MAPEPLDLGGSLGRTDYTAPALLAAAQLRQQGTTPTRDRRRVEALATAALQRCGWGV